MKKVHPRKYCVPGGKVELEKYSFTDYAWVNTKEFKKFDCLLGITEEVEETIKLFQKND